MSAPRIEPDGPLKGKNALVTSASRGIGEAVYRLASGDPRTLTGTIGYAEPFLKERGVQPAELV